MLSAIVAISENRVIGVDNNLPWHLRADLQHFKQVTTGHAIIMGRKTYESIGRPLPHRENVVITRDESYKAKGCTVLHSLRDAFESYEDAFIIGGAQLYEASMPYIEQLFLTEVHTSLEGDAYFPELNKDEWREVSRERFSKDEQNDFDYSFVQLIKE